MFKRIKTTILCIVLFLTLFSCAHYQKNVEDMLPREGFVHLRKTLTVSSCNNDHCISMKFNSAASGFVINKQRDGAFVLTAAHFCEDSVPKSTNGASTFSTYKVRNLYGEEYNGVLLHYKQDIDVCLMFVEGLTNDIIEIEMSSSEPIPGEKVYNIGAPLSIFGPDMVPILEGRFNGNLGNRSFYSLPAAPGSSGSMIINADGELIGIVQAVYIRFNTISLSVTHEDLKNYIDVHVKKYIAYKNVMKDLGLKNIFIVPEPN
jgi:S1-C subfamily serine protease